MYNAVFIDLGEYIYSVAKRKFTEQTVENIGEAMGGSNLQNCHAW